MRSTFCLLALIGFTSCATINYLDIETYNPAEITFPVGVDNILIVNNAVPQPEWSGYTFKLLGVEQDTCRAKADSALVYACRMLGRAILEENYFRDVLLYNKPIRTDNEFLVDRKLSSEQVDALCRETGADAVITLDKLLFSMNKEVFSHSSDFIEGDIRVDVSGIVRAYLPNRISPLATIQTSDSLFWSESVPHVSALAFVLPQPDEALMIAGAYIGGKVYPNFVPYWDNETRWYYTAVSAAWKEATAYARAGKWEDAAQRWELIYNKSQKWETKAKAASNIALAYEMTGKFREAESWVGKASALWDKNAPEDDRDRKMTALYAKALTERIRANIKLDQQIGVE